MASLRSNIKMRSVVIIMLAIVMVFSAVGIAAAQDPGGNGRPRGERLQALVHLDRIVNDTAAEALGVTAQEMLESMEDGQTVRDYLTANNVDVDQVIADASAEATEAINTALTENRITQEQADRFLSNLSAAIDLVLDHPKGERPADNQPGRRAADLARIVYETAADALGMTVHELNQSAEADQSLSDLISANGDDPAQISADAQATATERINTAVSEGRLSQEEADEMLANLPSAIEIILNNPLPRPQNGPNPDQRGQELREAANVIAESLGMTPEELLQAWRDGSTLSEIITANGGDVAAVTQTLIDAATERINTAVSEGTLTQERADELLQNLPDQIERLLNAEFQGRPGPGRNGQRGQGFGGDGSQQGVLE